MKSLKRCSPGALMDGTDTNDFRGGGGGEERQEHWQGQNFENSPLRGLDLA
jgi:hypothetical protein